MKKEVICPVCGRVHTCKTKDNLCKKHLQQFKKFGEFKDHNPRNKFDPNEIRINGDTAELDVYDLSGNVIKTFKFDSEDYDIVSRYKWNLGPDGYCRSGYSSIRLHRLVLGVKEGCQGFAGQLKDPGIRMIMEDKLGIICMHGHNNRSSRRFGNGPAKPGG